MPENRSVSVSVVLPTHNRAATLAESVQSILDQSFRNFELIVVDDGSEDDTLGVLSKIDDLRLKVIALDENKGANTARNTGIKAASGTFIAFQDSDDIWHTDKLEKQIEACTVSGALICFSAFERIRSGRVQMVPKPSYSVPPGRHNLSTQLLFGSFISNQTLLIHRSCLHMAKFDEALGRLQDWDLCLRLARIYDIFYLDQAMVSVREGENQISAGAESYVTAVHHIAGSHRYFFEDNPEAAATLWLNTSALALRHKNFQAASLAIQKAMTTGVLTTAKAALRLMRRGLI